jgi:repressor LexA|tara:strand:+ start:78 stop:338 length:261 start_codon:yes stop_codon:yes gene_type:complete
MNICKSCNRPLDLKYYPTSKEKKIIRFILTFQENNKKTPSFREIAEHFNSKAIGNIHKSLHKLQDKGFLHMVAGEYRSITILREQN